MRFTSAALNLKDRWFLLEEKGKIKLYLILYEFFIINFVMEVNNEIKILIVTGQSLSLIFFLLFSLVVLITVFGCLILVYISSFVFIIVNDL